MLRFLSRQLNHYTDYESKFSPKRKCILQLRGVRPFKSDKYDLTQHPNYKLTAGADKKNTFSIEEFLDHRLKLKSGDKYEVVDTDHVK